MKFELTHPKAALATVALIALSPFSATALSKQNVPAGLAFTHSEGRVDPGKEMNLTIVLKMHNQGEFDKLVEDLYDPASPRYHQWLTDKDFEQYAPTEQEFATVREELVRQGFTVISSDPQRFSLRVHGTAANVEKAFQTELENRSYNGRTFQAHTRDAHLAGPAGELIQGVSGIDRHAVLPAISRVINPTTGSPRAKRLLKTREDLASFASAVTDSPLTWSSTPLSLSTVGAKLPTAKYTGYQYAADLELGGFTPTTLQAHYGLPITQGETTYNGAGQTIALVEGYGYPTAEADANAAVNLWNSVDPSLKLPKLTSSNFQIFYPEGKPLNPNAGVDNGWDVEIALDIQSAHAIAPGAKIVVVASSGQDNEDQIASLNYIISPNGKKTPLAYAVSSSWENDEEAFSGADEEAAFTAVLKLGAAAGISFQFSSGDSGDNGFGTPLGSVGVPANSAYVTAVGGTAVLNNPNSTSNPWVVTGWGNDLVLVYNDFSFTGVEDPPFGSYTGGAGGGESLAIPRPTWQSKKLGLGAGRLVPDVSALADPYTGFALVVTEFGSQFGEVIGGTSLASPIFTATWAIADQFAGKPLGQAARLVTGLKGSQITDVVPPGATLDADDAAGSITDSKGTHNLTRTTLFTHSIDENSGGPLTLYSQGAFLSAIWPIPDEQGTVVEYAAITFGTDSSLTVTKGWDNVTGWGEPNGLPFIQAVTGLTTGAKAPKK